MRRFSIRRQKQLACVATAISIIFGAALMELGTRLLGFHPWQEVAMPIFAPDPVLGWVKAEGTILMPPMQPGGVPSTFTHWSRYLRATAPNRVKRARKVALIGCSHTHGFGLSDRETFAWKLQESFPQVEILNLGTSGYGTFQSLLTLRELYRSDQKPRVVVYGYINDHRERNVAPSSWLRMIGHVPALGVPYVTLKTNHELEEHPPARYPHWYFAGHSSLLATLEALYSWMITPSPSEHVRTEITVKLLEEMKQITREHGAQFRVAYLDFNHDLNANERARRMFERAGVKYFNCNLPVDPRKMIPVDLHPNASANTDYAECVAAGIKPLL